MAEDHYFDIWCVNEGGETSRQKDIIALLRKRGLGLSQDKLCSQTRPGIIFFDRFSTFLCDTILKTSYYGLNRVFAISTSDCPLGYNDMWMLLDAGASDVLDAKQDDIVDKIMLQLNRWIELDGLLDEPRLKNSVIGENALWRRLLRQLIDVGKYSESNILIMGESGTGKELVAKMIHDVDGRPEKNNFIILDCTTIMPELSGSEFFGHERGAFTGAVKSRDGAFALAHNGTLFLDEVGELPFTLQAQLLRVIQEKKFKRVGGNAWFESRFRLICATNRNLREAVKSGEFRRDLFFRISEWTFELPPLRKRKEDILLLARHFMRQTRPDLPLPDMDGPLQTFLAQNDYPGNIRDLKHLIGRIMFRYAGKGPVTAGDLPETERPNGDMIKAQSWKNGNLSEAVRIALMQKATLKDIQQEVERISIKLALTDESGSVKRAAKRLGLSNRILQMRRAAERKVEKADERTDA